MCLGCQHDFAGTQMEYFDCAIINLVEHRAEIADKEGVHIEIGQKV